jgi:peptidoglycan hydrolase CwlO-like protein
MPKKKPKLAVLADRIAAVRRVIDAQQALLVKLRMDGDPAYEAEVALRTYASSLAHLIARADQLREEARAKKGETKKGESNNEPSS